MEDFWAIFAEWVAALWAAFLDFLRGWFFTPR